MKRILITLAGAGLALALVGAPAYADPSDEPSASTSVSASPSPSASVSVSVSASATASASATEGKEAPCWAYVYAGTKISLCDRFGGTDRDDVTCTQVGFQVSLLSKADPWGLDGGGDSLGIKGLGCESKPRHPKPTVSASRTSSSPEAGVSLPVTGPPVWPLIPAGVAVLGLGAIALLAARRRRTRFTA